MANHGITVDDDAPRRSKLLPVKIPERSRVAKPLFWGEPPRAKVLEIVRFVSETGKAHLHPEVTYSTFPPGTDIRFLEVFSLHERFKHDMESWCVCAACPHDYPKFKDNGIVCWFPAEGVIRIVGGDCYKRHDPLGHQMAWDRYAADKKKRQDETYLLGSLHIVPLLLRGLAADKVVAAAVDKLRVEVMAALKRYELDLGLHTKDGKLRTENRVRQKAYGTNTTRIVTHKGLHAQIKGYKFLDLRMDRFAPRIEAIITALRKIDFAPPYEERVLSMTDGDRRRVASELGGALKGITKLHNELDDVRKFIAHETKATLRTWSQLPNASLGFFFEFDEGKMQIGMSGLRNDIIATPTMCYEALTPLPPLRR